MTGFTGFGPKALPFFEALKFHQSREWFEENRSLYENDVLVPMVALIDDLTAAFTKRKIPLRGDGKRSIFRLNRDIRFSKDKSPYKTHAGAVMTRSGSKKDNGLLYIHIDPTGCFTAAGFYMPEAPALAEASEGDARASRTRRRRCSQSSRRAASSSAPSTSSPASLAVSRPSRTARSTA